MKIRTLSRSTASHQAPGSNVSRQPRNLDPALHPFESAREYTRALNATKLERVFAAPFVGDFGRGHVDGVYSISNDPGSLERFASGSGDGVVKVWDLPSRDEVWQTQAHENIVKGVCWTRDRRLLSCGTDRAVQLFDPYGTSPGSAPIATYLGSAAFTGISQKRSEPKFAASSNLISIYDLSRPSSTPSESFSWPTSVDTFTSVAFNPVETDLLAATSADRSLTIFDQRTHSPAFPRTVLTFACNSISWNPMEAFNLAVASEDHNIYLFDVRNTARALNILKDHVAAVMSVAFSPTGEELVSASYDRSVRLWHRAKGHSRDVYTTKRMQRVFAATFTSDNNYVVSGSDDGNLRLWRAQAASRAGVKSARERQKREYDEALKERYKHMPEIKRILRHRHLPRQVKKAAEIKQEELQALRRRAENERKHTKKGKKRPRTEREKMVLAREQ
ncbi:WD40 repeat-like protein [Viridothelium virens]|uniref:WD40 repeat-like protein n=1 Tax=Viridothelium virens TaxID=1048519 RepID=A0A6A6H6Q2_VIRVR|nr:WD40 repeat-like protein [Viridothelium virens]